MTLSQTGVLHFSWPEISGADSYKVSTYLDGSKVFQEDGLTGINYTVNNLTEGANVFLKIYKQFDGLTSNIPNYTTETQTADVYNFHDVNKFLSINNFTFNDFIYNNGSLINYESQINDIHFNLITPRDDTVIKNFVDEPFLKKIDYYLKSNDTILESGSLNSLNFNYTNLYQVNEITGNFIFTDFYEHAITGSLTFSNPELQVLNVSKQFKELDENNCLLYIRPQYSISPDSLNYTISYTSGHDDIFLSGSSNLVNELILEYPLNTTGYLNLSLSHWSNTGLNYNFNQPLYFTNSLEPIAVYSNTIYESNVLQIDNQYINIYYKVNNINDYPFYSTISIDPTSSGSFDVDSYFTGLFFGSIVDFQYDFFKDMYNNNEDYYININLIQSGNSIIDDSIQKYIHLDLPKISNCRLSFDYYSGLNSLMFETEPNFEFNYINVQYSGLSQNNFIDFTGQDIIEYNDLADYTIRILDSGNSFLFDEFHISGSATPCKVSVNEMTAATLDNTVNLLMTDEFGVDNFQDFHVYRKKAFKWVSGDMPSVFSDILVFDNYENYKVEESFLGHWIDYAPADITRNRLYPHVSTISGIVVTGYYESGRDYVYRFVAENGFGPGIPTESKLIRFPSNSYQEANVDQQIAAEEEILLLEQTKSSLYDNQVIEGVNTFSQNIILTANPELDYHVATKSYVDLNAGDLIRKTYSQFNSGSEIISGNDIFLSNILYGGNIKIDDVQTYFSPQSLFYPIECNKLQAETPGQISYFLSDPFTGVFILPPSPSPTPSFTPTPTQTFTPTVTPSLTSSATPTQTFTPTVTPSLTSSATPTQTVTPTVTPSLTSSITPTPSY